MIDVAKLLGLECREAKGCCTKTKCVCPSCGRCNLWLLPLQAHCRSCGARFDAAQLASKVLGLNEQEAIAWLDELCE